MLGFEIYYDGCKIYEADEYFYGETEEEVILNARMVIIEDITERDGYEGLGFEDFEIEIVDAD